MSDERQVYDDQEKLWNGPAGRAWVEAQDVLDGMFQPFEDCLVEAATAASGGRVLDVGCGTGSTTLAIARRLGSQGRAVGIDLSAPMLAVAQARAEREGVPADFIRADAQAHTFEPASFDRIVSRFGVMFFDDPGIAFANLRRAARGGAELRFVAWRSAAENPFMTTAERAAATLLPRLPARRPGAPGQFAFADRNRVQAILEERGWSSIDIQPIDVTCTLPEQDLIRYLSWLGPVGVMLQQADEQTRSSVIATVRAAFEPYVHGTEVRFTAACWLVGAQAS
ncbi:class I SAM-dependent methyltransferase [Pseudomonas aeruginosa]|uniref:class I SAM-dependent methyltransferase n=1 Tax=Pseudomonas aeruginosa TaxID=287 RepID=UPI001245137F|nr:class I SAM-dependent methyltransferase [Pseudomonas aeruginosa]ELC7284776.1 class I SAM-dependent methyltransferase [Pseudomonas aeruginosa]ELJ2354455.1 class I SAM-dependent methyltransferase [Pseudomonas aeruginosa]KAB0757210.1 class I SAM-dependent methyltransferase [Pseudomonas aeruginosa]MCW5475470.1 class I SAM-dependent methyltransferase [Pseudomonas aeruginosa]MCW5481944.1 class I SAM-dependent methyltransferase [Pseudomonas aeruginosa]